jgi:hypothetical protein
MFWVALATAIMMLSGEGDDTRAILALIAGLRNAITQSSADSPRQAEALRAVSEFEQAFTMHRQELQAFGKCVEAADRKYHATRADYAACEERIEAQRIALRGSLAKVQHDYEASLTPGERAQVAEAVTRLPEAWVLDPTIAANDNDASAEPTRARGLEGVASQRHLTLPRNVVQIVHAPLGPATFGQRYPSKIIDGGTSYARQDITGSNVTTGVSELWFTRLGVRFGLFDDFEAGALFLPFELAPDFRFDSVLVFLTQQFRMKGFDVGLRLSFQTPGGDTGWALAPGALIATRGQKVALQAGLFSPMEVGSFREPRSPLVGFNAPVRVIWNVVPAFFLSADSGVAYDNLAQADRATVPLGFGAGYALLAGSKLIEFTTSFTWDHWLLASRPNDASALQFKTFRVALGATISFQAL